MTPENGNDADCRLPRNAVPRRYELTFRPDLAAGRFTGSAAIDLELVEASSEIVCNAAELDISSAALRRRAGDDATPLAVRMLPEHERAVLSTDAAELAPGDYVLELDFGAELNDKLRGFYRSTFEGSDGELQSIATTQFESTYARKAFPCWDEPDRKAVFSIALEVDEGLATVSNSRELATTVLPGGKKRVEFHDTIPMSTYLVCLTVGALETTEPVDVGGVPLAVVTPIGKKHLAGFALEAASHALRWFSDYYGLPYPGDKLDLVDVPDFAMGAMENLGCVTFREVYLLCDPETSSIAELSEIAEVIEHELAHMWFGDLVTMKWWNGIWLNEAFATYMSVCCLQDFRPQWQPWVTFGRSKDVGLATDGLHSTRPIEFPVRRPDEAEAMFDVLTYQKGGNVLRMLEQYLGTERFREGVRRYLATHRYANTETTDLWDAIESASAGRPVRALMDSWIFQGGFPLVTASLVDGELVLSEQPFSYLSLEQWAEEHPGEPSGIGRDWIVPVRVTERHEGDKPDLEGGPQPVTAVLLGPAPHAEQPVRLPVGSGLPVVNAGGSGTYRLRYTGQLFESIASNLDRLSALERFNLVSDTWATTLAGISSLGDFLALTKRLSGEIDPNVWSIVAGALGLCDLAVADADRPAFEAFVRRLLRGELERVGIEARSGEIPEIPRSRATFVSLLGMTGADEDVRSHCRQLFDAAEQEGRALPADTAEAILHVVAFGAGPKDFDRMFEHVRHPLDPIDGDRHLLALANVRDVALAERLQQLCLTEVRTQDAPYVLRSLLTNRVAGPSTWRFVASHFDELRERYTSQAMVVILGGIPRLADLDELGEPLLAGEVKADLRAREMGGRRRLIEQHLERLEVNVRFVKENRPTFGELLAKA